MATTEELIRQSEEEFKGKSTSDLIAMANSELGGKESKPSYPPWVTSFDKSIINFPRSLGGVILNMAKGVASIPGIVQEGLKNNDPLAPEKAVYNAATSLAKNLVEKYNSIDKIKTLFEEDPASIMSDLSIFKNSLDPTRLVTGPIKTTFKYAMDKAPKQLYGSALKIKEKYPLDMQEKMIEEGLSRKSMPTEGGVSKVTQGIQDIENKVMPSVESAQTVIQPQSIASRLGDVLDRDVINQATPLKDLGTLAKKEREFLQLHPAPMSVKEAHLLKKSEYAKAQKSAYEGRGTADVESSKALARGAKEEVYDALSREFPQLKALELGKQEGVLINLKKALEDATKRLNKHDILPLKTAIGAASQSVPVLAASVLDFPKVKAALAIALKRADVLSKRAKPVSDVISKLPPYAYGIGSYGGNNGMQGGSNVPTQ